MVSSIFYFQLVNDSWIYQALYVKTNLSFLANMESGQQIYRGDSGDSNDSSVGDIPIELPHLEARYLYYNSELLASLM